MYVRVYAFERVECVNIYTYSYDMDTHFLCSEFSIKKNNEKQYFKKTNITQVHTFYAENFSKKNRQKIISANI